MWVCGGEFVSCTPTVSIEGGNITSVSILKAFQPSSQEFLEFVLGKLWDFLNPPSSVVVHTDEEVMNVEVCNCQYMEMEARDRSIERKPRANVAGKHTELYKRIVPYRTRATESTTASTKTCTDDSGGYGRFFFVVLIC
jgi:hypothetical protein